MPENGNCRELEFSPTCQLRRNDETMMTMIVSEMLNCHFVE